MQGVCTLQQLCEHALVFLACTPCVGGSQGKAIHGRALPFASTEDQSARAPMMRLWMDVEHCEHGLHALRVACSFILACPDCGVPF